MFRLILVILAGAFGLPLATYIAGRILLPEMGLTAPEYWTWFWVSVIVVIVYGIVRGIQETILS